MDPQTLSRLLDKLIADLLVHKRSAMNDGRKKVRVVITGEDVGTLSTTIPGLQALDKAGYQLSVTFSHSASLSGLKEACIRQTDASCRGALFSEQGPQPGDEDYTSLYLPALSTNSLSKIALGIRDNIASSWVFHALDTQKQIIATLNPECLKAGDTGFAPPLLTRLAGYVTMLEQYGIVIAGRKIVAQSAPVAGRTVNANKRLITLSDIRLHPATEGLRIDSHTLITPAARDEIRQQNITVIKG